MDLASFQRTIRDTYGDRDRERGVDATFGWFIEEVGELSRALRRQGHAERVVEFSDVLAWLVTLADLSGVDLAEAAERYAGGCPKCSAIPCRCGEIRTGGTPRPGRAGPPPAPRTTRADPG